MKVEDIREHPSYVCNQIALKLGVFASLLTSIFCLFYSAPHNFLLASSVLILGIIFYAIRRWVFPRVRNTKDLDRVVLGYNLPIVLMQWFAIALFPSVEVSTSTGSMMVLHGFLFTSKSMMMATSFGMALGWIIVKTLCDSPPSINEHVQLLLIAPTVALIARLATAHSVLRLQEAKYGEEKTVRELRGTLACLEVERTRREKSEAQYLRAQKNESLGLMAVGVAHDFNNMLSAINTFAELILSSSSEVKSKNHASEIIKAVRQSSAICKQMLTYAGKTPSQRSVIDLVEIITHAKFLLKAITTGRASFDVVTEIESGLILGNPSQLQQVLINLVTNAAESIDKNELGKISLRIWKCKHHEIGSDGIRIADPPAKNEDYVGVSVSDTGSGMGEETLRQIFDPYFTTKGPGHGFGLSTVLGMVKGHEGILDVSSRLGNGTTVSIYFPTQSTLTSEVQIATIEQQRAHDQRRVLLVDDDDLVRESLGRMLHALDWEVVKASNGQDALEFLRDPMKFSVLIFDFNMPGMSGRDLLFQVRNLGIKTPAILCSGSILEQKDSDDRSLFQGFLPKPTRLKDLQELLDKFTRS